MKRLLLLSAAVALGACTDTAGARRAALYGDKPADISCHGWHGPLFVGRSTGKVQYDDGGRVNFVDARTGRLVVVEGECVVVYDR